MENAEGLDDERDFGTIIPNEIIPDINERLWSVPNADEPPPPVFNVIQYMFCVTGCINRFGGVSPWFRGHSDASWTLVPGAFRSGRSFHSEKNMARRFMNDAPGRYSRCPELEDYPGWLMLMQHYRLPTRLLDWSTSPLVALFFAVSSEAGKDGAVWVMNPFMLNASQHRLGISNIRNHDMQHFISQAFGHIPPEDKGQHLATNAAMVDHRMMLQGAAFTIHDGPTPLDRRKHAEKFLIQFRVPKEAKNSIRQFLEMLGVSAATLFPDLDHLAESISRMNFPVHTQEELRRTGQLPPEEETDRDGT